MPLCIGWGVACVSVSWLHLQSVAAIYQAVGVLLTALGLAAIGDRIRRARDTTAAAIAKTRSGLGTWSAQRREQLALAWARLTRRPRSVTIRAASAQARVGGSATLSVEVKHHRVDRDTISDRDWLAYLDDRLESVFVLMDAAAKRNYDDREDFDRRLGIQRDELRDEIIRETRNGWQLVAWGLGYTFIGVVLGAFA